MFLTNWLILQIVAAGVTGAVEYPSAADFFMNFDSNNSLYFTGGSKGYASNLILYKGETEYPVYNGSVSNIYISDPETYVSYIQLCNETYVTNTVDVQTVVNPEGTFPDTATNIIPGYATSSSWSQGSMGSYVDFNGDGTRMVVGMGLYNTNQGRAAVYHLENGTWVQKVDLAPTSTSTRFGDSVLMNEDGTRIAVNYYQNNTIKIYEYTNGVWPTTPTTSISGTFGSGDMDWNTDGTVLAVAQGESGNNAYIYTRDSGTGNWSLTKTWSNSPGTENSIAINGAGTRIIVGCYRSGGSTNNWVSSIYEANYDSGTSTWSSLTEVGTYSHTGNTTWPARLRMNNDGTRLVAIGQATDASDTNIWHRQSGTSWTKTFDIPGMCSIYSRGSGSISYDGTMVLTGDYRYNGTVTNQGRAYLYEYSGGSWSLTKTYENPKTTPVASDGWGYGTAITKLKDRIAIGMAGDDTTGTDYGSLYVYDLEYSYPTLTQDNYNKLTLNSLTPTAGRITFGSNTYDAGNVSNFYVSEPGTYEVSARSTDAYAIVKKTVATPIDTTGTPYELTYDGYNKLGVSNLIDFPDIVLAFHYGTFADSGDPYGDGTLAGATANAHVFADTATGTYSWGTLAHVKERENPDFTANSTLETDYSSTYGWTTNTGWEVSAKDIFSSTYSAWKAFNKNYEPDNTWLSGSAPSTSSPQWLKIKYPSQQVIKSYVIRSRDDDSPRFPTAWKLQGSNNDSDWTDIGTEQTQTEWEIDADKSFDVSTNTTAYQYYRLRITGARESASSSNSDYVAIGHWFLFTETSGSTVHTRYTKYIWTMSYGITANVLMVAGGGGGGGVFGGGGGAGGLLFHENEIVSGQKIIAVGNGGAGGIGNPNIGLQHGIQGTNTSFTGLTTTIGGGGGNGFNTGNEGTSGGSGSGGAGDSESLSVSGRSGILGQGNAGGTGGSTYSAGGGGGAGSIGGNASASSGGNGGLGVDKSSVFGTTYGDSGWFASGGGGGAYSQTSQTAGTASQGGGTGGTNTTTAADDAQKHTGGGGGGAGYNVASTSELGGRGGSGIVLVKYISEYHVSTLRYESNTYDIGTTSTIIIQDPGRYEIATTDNQNFMSLNSNVTDQTVTQVGVYDYTQADTTEQQITATNAATQDKFKAVAIDGDYAIVGAIGVDSGQGAAYIFVRNTTTGVWFEQQKLTATDGEAGDAFGRSVAIDGDYAVIHSANDDDDVTNSGALYVFKRDTTTGFWLQHQKLKASDPGEDDSFGYSVNISGDYIITGAQYNDDTYTSSGSAHIYTRDPTTGQWGSEQKLTANNPATDDYFGSTTTISGDYAFVGSRGDDDNSVSGSGSVYVFKRNATTGAWSQDQKLTASDPTTDAGFGGGSIAISGDYLIIGTNAGGAYIFKLDTTTGTWSEQQKLTPSDGAPGGSFGSSVSISGDYAIVGALGNKSAYIYKRDGTTWSEQIILYAGGVATSVTEYGGSVAISGGYAFVGARGYNTYTGAAYIYTAENLASTLAYDGLNTLVLSNVSTGSYNTFLEGSNVLACATDLTTYPVPKSGITGTFTYSARTKSDSAFAFTNDVSITDYYKTYQYPPIDGTTTGLTSSTTSATWTISGVQYSTESSVAGTPYNTFDNSITSGFDSTSSTGDIIITFESAKTIRKYIVWPYDSTAPVSTPGGSTDPTLSTDGTFRPKSWVLYGTNNLNDWSTVLDTVTNQPPSIYGDVHSISSPASYQYYKLSVTANNGGSGLKIGEWQLWGDA
jgi:hypothetical protein